MVPVGFDMGLHERDELSDHLSEEGAERWSPGAHRQRGGGVDQPRPIRTKNFLCDPNGVG